MIVSKDKYLRNKNDVGTAYAERGTTGDTGNAGKKPNGDYGRGEPHLHVTIRENGALKDPNTYFNTKFDRSGNKTSNE